MTFRHFVFSLKEAMRAGLASIYAILVAVLIAALLIWLIGEASAHDWYPPACCSGGDCAPVDSSRITRDGVDYVIDQRWKIPRADVKLSPDGRFHGCWPNKEKPPVCVYAPPDGT